ncbi:unnamed protein product, partial [Prorocentrum cordatum]
KIVLEYRPRRSPPAQTGDCRSNHPFRQLLTIINIRKATFGWPFSMTSRVNKPINLLSVCRILLVLACRATCADLHFDGTSGSQTSFSEESTFLIQIHGFSNNTPGLTSSTGGNSTTATTKARAPTGGTTSPGVPKYTLPRGKGEDAKAARQWLLVLADDATDGELANISREFADGQQTKPSSGQMPLVAGSLTEEALDAMLERYFGRVRFVEEDEYQLKVTDSLANTGTSSAGPARKAKTPTYPWGIQYVEADACRGKGAGVHVYVLDTGIRITHNEFGGRAFAGVDVAASGTYPGTLTVCSPLSTTCAADFHGHGSHCAGTAGASTYGVADGATLWAMKVLDNSGSGWTSWSILAEQWILSSGNRPAVVSISIQANYNSYAEETSIDNLVADGVTVVVAAGNYNQDACLWNPAWISSAITVAAFGGTSGNSWDRSGYSNWGSCIDAYAPGTNILSTGPWSDTHTYSSTGTSMACPHISGLAARMYEAYPTAGSMTAAARWTLLTATSCTGCVTNDATPSPTVNLVIKALSCSTSNITASPTASPTGSPTALPTASPTATPTLLPTVSPTPSPTVSPTASPSATPTASPTASPTVSPTGSPTAPPTSPTPAPSWSQVVNNCTVCPDIQIFSDCPGHSPDSCASAGTTSPGCEWCPLVNECRVKCTCHDDAPPAYSLFDSCAYSGGVPTQQVLFWPIFLSPSYTSYAPECECPSWRTPAPTVDTTDPTPSPTQEGDPSPAPTKQGQDPTPAPTRRPTPSPTEQTNEPTPSPTPEGQDPTPAPTKQGQDPTPAPTRRPTPSPTHSCGDACCVGIDPNDPECCDVWHLGSVTNPSDCEAYHGGDMCVWTCSSEHPTPAPTQDGQDPTPAPTKQGQDPTPAPTPSCEDACCVGVDPTDPKCCHLWNAGVLSSPADCEAYNGGDFCVWTCPTEHPTPAPTHHGFDPTPSPTEPTKEPTPSPTPEGQNPTPAPTNNCTVCPDIQIFSDCPGHSPDSCASAGTTSPGCEWCPLVNECRVKCTCHDDAPPAYSLFDSCAYSGGVPTQQVLFWPIFLSPSYTSYAPECVCPSWRTPAPTADTTDPTPAPTKQGQDPTARTRRLLRRSRARTRRPPRRGGPRRPRQSRRRNPRPRPRGPRRPRQSRRRSPRPRPRRRARTRRLLRRSRARTRRPPRRGGPRRPPTDRRRSPRPRPRRRARTRRLLRRSRARTRRPPRRGGPRRPRQSRRRNPRPRPRRRARTRRPPRRGGPRRPRQSRRRSPRPRPRRRARTRRLLRRSRARTRRPPRRGGPRRPRRPAARTLAAWALIPPTPSAATSGTLAQCPPQQIARRTTAEISASGPAPPSTRRLLRRITALIRRRPRQSRRRHRPGLQRASLRPTLRPRRQSGWPQRPNYLGSPSPRPILRPFRRPRRLSGWPQRPNYLGSPSPRPLLRPFRRPRRHLGQFQRPRVGRPRSKAASKSKYLLPMSRPSSVTPRSRRPSNAPLPRRPAWRRQRSW